MSVSTRLGRLVGYATLSIVGALAAVTVSNGLASAAPRAPLPTDDQVPAVPFDPGALINAIDNYANLLSILTGGRSTPPSLGPGVTGPAVTAPVTAPAPAGTYPMLPGV